MSDVIYISDKDELEKVLSDNPEVVVKFTAPSWCGPCRQFAPHFETASEKSDALFVSVDLDEAPWAGEAFGFRTVPTVMLYRDGNYVKNLQERTVIRLLKEIDN